ncbi:MAG: peptidylprolyl isomerase [Bacteroidota bacterium]
MPLRGVLGGILVWSFIGCNTAPPPEIPTAPPDVILTTDLGDIQIKLYDETPIHRENFLKLCREGFYDSLSFHRIIKSFMVQSGDPRTRHYRPGQPNGPGYDLPAELRDDLVHTYGAVAAAREPDNVNPEKRSEGSQFYIVTGRPTPTHTLDSMERIRTIYLKNRAYERFEVQRDSGDTALPFQEWLDSMGFVPFQYTAAQRAKYQEQGGSISLDFNYTVFGEVVAGMRVARILELSKTNEEDQPLQAVRIQSVRIVSEEKSN